MTKAPVTITYGHGKLYDCTDADVALFAKTENGQTLAALASIDDDVFDINATNSAGSKVGYYSNTANLGLSTTTFKKILVRYKCSNGVVMAGVMVVFSDAVTQVILNNTNSTTWKVVSATLTTGKTLDHIELFCNEDVGHVYYDFALVFTDTFSFPNSQYGVSLKPPSRYGVVSPVGMVGSFQQNLGGELADIEIGCNTDLGTWVRAGDVLNGQVFLDILHNSVYNVESWQWIDLGDLVAQFKAVLVLPELVFESRGEGATHRLALAFREFRRRGAQNETYIERFGLNL